MGASIRVMQAAAATGGGNQSFTISGFGTPKAAMFFWTNCVTNGTALTTAALMGVGATDGVRDRSCVRHDLDAAATMNCDNRAMTDKCICLIDSAGAVTGEANFNAWVTDGVQVNWTNAPNTAVLVTCILFNGDDLTAYVDDFTTPATINTATDVTAPGFQPDLVIPFSAFNPFDDTQYGDASISVGFVRRTPSVVQASISQDSRTGTSASSQHIKTSALYCAGTAGEGGEAVEIAEFDASGFSAYTRLVGAAYEAAYLALKIDNHQTWIGNPTSPTGTGNKSQTGVGFKPQFVMQVYGNYGTLETVDSTGDAQSIAVGVFDATDEFCNGVSADDGALDQNCESLTDAKSCRVRVTKGTDAYAATFVTMDAGGWTLNFTASTVSRRWAALAIEEDTAAATAIPVMDHHYRMQRVA